jgi:hypothetical protein
MADGEGAQAALEEVPVEVAPAEDQKAEETTAEESDPAAPAAEAEADSTTTSVADGVSAAAAPVADKLNSFKDLVVSEVDHETPALEFTEDSPPPTPQASEEAPGPVPSDSELDVTSVPRELGDGLAETAATAESKLKEVLPGNDELPAVAKNDDDDAADEPEMVDASPRWLDNIYPSMKKRADSVVNHPVVAKTTETFWQTAGAAHERMIQPIVSHPYVQKGTQTLKAGGAYTLEKGRNMRLAPILGFVIGVALLGVAVQGIHHWRCGPNNEQACPTMAELSCELRSRATHLKSVGHTKFLETFGDKFGDMKVGDKFHKFIEQFSDKLGFHKKVEL